MLWKDVKGICGQTIDKVTEQKTETQARLESGSKVLENKRLKIGLMLHNIIETILYDRFLFWKEKTRITCINDHHRHGHLAAHPHQPLPAAKITKK